MLHQCCPPSVPITGGPVTLLICHSTAFWQGLSNPAAMTFWDFITLFCCFSNLGVTLAPVRLSRVWRFPNFILVKLRRCWRQLTRLAVQLNTLFASTAPTYIPLWQENVFLFSFCFYPFFFSLSELPRLWLCFFDWHQKGPGFCCLHAGLGCAHWPTFLLYRRKKPCDVFWSCDPLSPSLCMTCGWWQPPELPRMTFVPPTIKRNLGLL